jgi:RNA polymerase sigma factor (sigma-70 family)
MTVGFDHLYHSEFGPVRAFLYRLGARGDDLTDLIHDTFVTALRRFATLDQSRPTRPWFLGIAFKVHADFRALHRHHQERLETPPEIPVAPTVDAEFEDRQQRSLIEQALETLEPAQRAVLVMHHFDGLTPNEISEAMSVPPATTYTRLRTARLALTQAVRRLEGVQP